MEKINAKKPYCLLLMKNGDSFLVGETFEKILNEINKSEQNNGFIVISQWKITGIDSIGSNGRPTNKYQVSPRAIKVDEIYYIDVVDSEKIKYRKINPAIVKPEQYIEVNN